MEDEKEKKNDVNDGVDDTTTTQNTDSQGQEKQGEEKQEKVDKTYTRDDLNNIINAERKKAKEEAKKELLEEMKKNKDEADKLAQMDEAQKLKYQFDTEKQRADKAEAKLNAFMLKDETVKQASEKGIPLAYLDLIDFSKENADSIKSKLDSLEKTVKAEREKVITEYSKEMPPQTGGNNGTTKPESQMTYEELAKLPKYKMD